MIKLSGVMRISIGLVLLTVTVILAADFFGLIPSKAAALLDARKKFCESLAVQCAVSAEKDDMTVIQAMISLVVDRNDDVLSAAVRAPDGTILAEAGDHQKQWKGGEDESTPSQALVPIFKDNARWATVELSFPEVGGSGL